MFSFFEKHKPKTLDDIVIASDKRDLLRKFADGKLRGNVLLHGPYGTGKSVTAEIIAKDRSVDSHAFFDGATMNEDDFDKIDGCLSWQRVDQTEFPAIVIDEVDKLPAKLQQRLRAKMDESSEFKPDFIMTTNNPHAIDRAILDRSRRIEFPEAVPTDWMTRARQILATENVSVPDKQLKALLTACDGSIRDIMRTLEELRTSYQR